MGAVIGEVEIKTIYLDSVSYINPIKDTIKFTRLLSESVFW